MGGALSCLHGKKTLPEPQGDATSVQSNGHPPHAQQQKELGQASAAGGKKLRYTVVDFENEAGSSIAPEQGNQADQYYEAVTRDRAPQPKPWLIIVYGPPACGKSSVVQHFVTNVAHAQSAKDYVYLDPDELRYYFEEYRHSINGVHAAKLEAVRREFGDRLQRLEWRSPSGGFTEEGAAVEGSFLALSSSALRTNALVRQAMLWGKGQKRPDGTREWPPMDDSCIIDRVLIKGYNVVYDTVGDAPDGLLRELIRRARSQHEYRLLVCGVFAELDVVKSRAAARTTFLGRHVRPPRTSVHVDLVSSCQRLVFSLVMPSVHLLTRSSPDRCPAFRRSRRTFSRSSPPPYFRAAIGACTLTSSSARCAPETKSTCTTTASSSRRTAWLMSCRSRCGIAAWGPRARSNPLRFPKVQTLARGMRSARKMREAENKAPAARRPACQRFVNRVTDALTPDS